MKPSRTEKKDPPKSTAAGDVSRRRLLQTGVAGAAIGLAGCLGGDGGDSDDDTPTTGTTIDTTTSPPTTTLDSDCEVSIEASATITEDTTWNCPQYVLTRDVAVREGATLTVGAGVEVVAEQGVRLVVADDSALVVEGGEGSPTVFRGKQETAGYWDGIEFATESTGSRLSNAEVAHGGNANWANVYVQSGSAVSLENCTVRDAATYGLTAERTASFPAFAGNTFSGNEGGALRIGTNLVGALDSASTYAGGAGPDRIEVFNENVVDDATWPATDAPFYFANDAPIRAAVTVEPGAQFAFAQGARLAVGADGSLTAVGAPDDRIAFRGDTAVSGFWDGIEFNSSNNRLEYVDVAHGGNGGWANVYVQSGASASLRNCSFRNSLTYGVSAERDASLAAFVANVFEGNEGGALRIGTNLVGALDSASTYAGGAGPDRIEVFNENVVDDATWPATDAPFYFANDAPIRAAVTVEPGAQFTFAQGARLAVVQAGSFNAVGAADDRITFLGETAVPGFWDGIEFASINPDNVLDNCEVAHGGNGGWANVYVQSTGLATVRNCLVRDSATYGIEVERNGRLTESNNDFDNNADGSINQSS